MSSEDFRARQLLQEIGGARPLAQPFIQNRGGLVEVLLVHISAGQRCEYSGIARGAMLAENVDGLREISCGQREQSQLHLWLGIPGKILDQPRQYGARCIWVASSG